MPHTDFETIRFQAFRDLRGDLRSVSCGKRNGQPSIFLPRGIDGVEDTTEFPGFDEQRRLFVNLNPVERETWRKILAARSIASIAQEEGVSRSAIYARIQGNRSGHGGMIAKNFWVLRWWQLRQQMLARARATAIRLDTTVSLPDSPDEVHAMDSPSSPDAALIDSLRANENENL